MNIQQALQSHTLKSHQASQKQQRIKQKLQSRQRMKANLQSTDSASQSHKLKGKIQKTKIIAKKQYKTYVQETRKIDVEVQGNAHAGTYVAGSREYEDILGRTERVVVFDEARVGDGCKAISAYAWANKQQYIQIQITMQNQIVCTPTPCLLRPPHPPTPTPLTYTFLTTHQNLPALQPKLPKSLNLKLMTLKQFITKYKSKQEKKFRKSQTAKNNRIFCEFSLFCRSGFVRRLLQEGVVVFPFQGNKVPYGLEQKGKEMGYAGYVDLLTQAEYFVAKGGTVHRIWIRNSDYKQLAENVKSIVYQMVSKLILKNKQKQYVQQNNQKQAQNEKKTNKSQPNIKKGNKLLRVKIKSQTSIPICIYQNQ